jgi:cell division protein FtsB
MNTNSRLWYLLALVTVCGLSWTYVRHENLWGRYQALQQGEAAVQSAREEIDLLDENLQESQERVQALATDPVELEAAIRRWNGKVREGETVYHMEETAAIVEPAPAAAAPSTAPPAPAPTGAAAPAPAS